MKVDWDGWIAKLYFALGVIVLLVVPLVLAMKGLGLIGFLFAVPLLAALAARLIVNRGGGVLRWFRHKALEEWQGTFYAYGMDQVRVYEDEGRLWFVVVDVLHAVRWKALPDRFRLTQRARLHPVEGTDLEALDLQGLEVLLGTSRDPEAGKFLLWARRDVDGPWQRKTGG